MKECSLKNVAIIFRRISPGNVLFVEVIDSRCIQICMCVHMYICVVCMYICMYVCMCGMYVCMCVCIYVCICVCMYMCMYVFMYVCIYVCMYVFVYVRMHICMYVWYVCTCIRTYVRDNLYLMCICASNRKMKQDETNLHSQNCTYAT